MFSTPPKGGALFVEPLEARIAPTVLIAYANDPAISSNPHYITYHTPPSSTKLGFVSGAKYGVAGSNVYALKLTAGDELLIYNPGTGFNTSDPFLKVNSGTLIAFFQDTNGDGQVQSNELTGISMSKNTSAEVNGNVNGDIVTNLTAAGTITLKSAGPATQSIGGLNIVGNVYGSILSGGSINSVTVTGSVEDVLAGSAVNNTVYHFGDPNIATGTLKAAPPNPHVAGASINDVDLLTVGVVRAGRGGVGAAGGSVTGLTLESDITGFDVFSGPGGRGTAKIKAGAGGDISGVTVKGVTDDTVNDLIFMQAGKGGPDAAYKGGAGGSIINVAVSFDTPATATSTPQQSAELLDNDITLEAGAGGMGSQGGAGGSIDNAYLVREIPIANGTNPEIEVLAGAGGAASGARGRGGAGGSVSQLTAEFQDTDGAESTSSTIVVEGGSAGAGGSGGGLFGLTLQGTILSITAGNGGAYRGGGGAGGSLNTIDVLSGSGVDATNVTLDAGTGGAGKTGGDGGNMTSIDVTGAVLASLSINDGTHANGGTGNGGLGGAGGSVTNMTIMDAGPAAGGAVTIRTGAGGSGFLGGGAGGDLGTSQANVVVIGTNFSYTVATGAGGNVLANGHGKGGAGGDLASVSLSNEPFDIATATLLDAATGTVTSGAGGNGTTGGAGGDMTSLELRASVGITMKAGNGGKGRKNAAGAGGSIFTSSASSLFGSVSATAGSGGTAGGGPGAGGQVSAFIAAAQGDVTIKSGAGTLGGAGGDILSCGTALDEVTQESNAGSLTVKAGNGSSANGVGGAGGSITVFNGTVGQSGTTTFTAGTGGGGTNKSVSGAGGSISNVTLTGADGVATNQVYVTFDAGNAGDAAHAKHGAAGGSVDDITISNLAIGTDVQHVAAGNGGHGSQLGGAGGSISQVFVGAAGDPDAAVTDDIGVISGLAYGYGIGTAGGLFAGVGGTSGKLSGAAGDVTDITAYAISSIAAGRASTPHLAHEVDSIFLDGLTPSTADSAGAFTNFSSANLVGSVIVPTAHDASTYVTGDGLIAAAIITNNRNFIPEAELTLSSNGQQELVDYRQPSTTPVVTPVG